MGLRIGLPGEFLGEGLDPECLLEVVPDQAPRLQGPPVIGLAVAHRGGEGAQQDPALDLLPETLPPGPGHEVGLPPALPEMHAVVSSQVAGRLDGRHQVVGRDPSFGVRQGDVHDLATPLLQGLPGRVQGNTALGT